MRCVLFILAVCALLARTAGAHEVRPAYLELRERTSDTYDVLWKVPARGDERLGLYVRFPADTQQVDEPYAVSAGGAYLERWRIRREGGLTGQSIVVDGLAATGTDVLVRLERLNGQTQIARLTPAAPSWVVQAAPGLLQVAGTYLRLGIEHILGGVDHLLFVLAMLILVKGTRRLVASVTAFTAAHSLTLAAAALGAVHVPQRPVEAAIAMSIVFVACGIVRAREGRQDWTEQRPWIVAFAFGLLHGLGFASALREVGLPQTAIPTALLLFNIGVEIGQLFFIAVVLSVIAVARRLSKGMVTPPAWAWRIAPYSIGSVAAFWMVQRIASF